MTHAVSARDSTYILGHSGDELTRLIDQARFFGDLTAQVLQRAGVGEGMRVLDAGCGAGDVSFLAANLIGPGGMVIGVDMSPEAVATATRRAEAAGLTNVRFLTDNIATLRLDEAVDAIVGRQVLMYLPDPAVVLRHLANFVKPGELWPSTRSISMAPNRSHHAHCLRQRSVASGKPSPELGPTAGPD